MRESEDLDVLFERIRSGSPDEQQAALTTLLDRTEELNTPAAWGDLGLGFFEARRFDDAIEVFRQLVEDFPDADQFRLNLATVYAQTQRIELCCHHFRYVAEHGATEEIRRHAQDRLRSYEALVGLGTENETLRELQIRSLREAILHGGAAADYVRLAKVLLRKGLLTGDELSLTEAAGELENGLAAFPTDADILELLSHCYMRHDPNGRLTEVMQRLERVNPDAELLGNVNRMASSRSSTAFDSNLLVRVNELLQQACTQTPDEREAALAELRQIVMRHPERPTYRLNYAFALAMNRVTDAALEQGRILAACESVEHMFHFNLGQVFWLSGDPINGRRHLELALRFASNDEERRDATERIEALEQRHEPS